jgi:hypothetical protein
MLLALGLLVSTLSSAAPAPAPAAPTPAVDAETRRLLLEGGHEAAAKRLEALLKQSPGHRAAAGLLAAMLVGVDDKRARELQSRLGPARPDPVIPPSRPVKAGALAYVATSRLRLREAARANAPANGWVAMGAPVQVERLTGEWAKVRVGRRTIKVVNGEGQLVHPARWSSTFDAAREGFLALAYLDGAPPDVDALLASARKAREEGQPDTAASYLLRVWSLRPHDAAVREALLDMALAAERFSVAVLATRPPSVARVPATSGSAEASGDGTTGEEVTAEGAEAPPDPYAVEEAGWVFGCRGSLPLAALTPRELGDGQKAAQHACAVDVDVQPECRPSDRRPDSYDTQEANDAFQKELEKEQRQYDAVALPAFNKKVQKLREQHPDGPYVRVKLTVSEQGSPPPLYYIETRYAFDSCDEMPMSFGESMKVVALKLPRLTEGEGIDLWFQVEDPVDMLYVLTGGDSPESAGKRLRELQPRTAPLKYLNTDEDRPDYLKTPGFWMLLSHAHDGCDSCRSL